jgi:hypothetical protein
MASPDLVPTSNPMRAILAIAIVCLVASLVPVGARAQPVPEPPPASAEAAADLSPGRPLVIGGAVLTAVGGTGVVFGIIGLLFEATFCISISSSGCTPTPDYAWPLAVLLPSLAVTLTGVVLLVVGTQKNAEARALSRARLLPSLAPTPDGAGAMLGLIGSF